MISFYDLKEIHFSDFKTEKGRNYFKSLFPKKMSSSH